MSNNLIDTSSVITMQYDQAYFFQWIMEAKEDIANMVVGSSWNAFFDKVFNIATCDKDGLRVWGAIVGVNWPTYKKDNVDVLASEDAYRKLLIAKIYLMSTSFTLPRLARFFSVLFDCGAGSGHPYRRVKITDNLNMTFEVEFGWVLSTEERALLETANLLTHPTGVELSVVYETEVKHIGFDGFYVVIANEKRYLIAATKEYWGKEMADGSVFSPNGRYYAKVGGTHHDLDYDAEGNNYYYTDEGGLQVVCGRDAQHPIYAVVDGNESQLSIIPPDSTDQTSLTGGGRALYYFDAAENKIFVKRANTVDGQAVECDNIGGDWYYMDGTTKKVVVGQNEDNFDNGIFGEDKEIGHEEH